MNDRDLEQQVIDGRIWADFCDHLKRAGEQILRPETPDDAFNRAEGWRYLTRLTRIALDMFVECNDPDFPAFYRPSHETAKIGADNPDNLYLRAQVNGNYDYRITGSRGTVHYLGFVTMAGGYGEDGRNVLTGSLDTAGDLQVDGDGRVEILLSKNPQPGNWVPMTADTNTVLVRQTFLDRDLELPADLTIERIGAQERPKPLNPAQLARNLKATSAFVEGTARLFADWSASYLPRPNELPPADQELCQSVGGDPNIFYYHSYFELEEDEALVVEVERIPDCQTWNLQVDNYWMESLDYRYHRIHINKHTAELDADGGVRIVIADRDPGVSNWLETAGHRNGTLCFRWIGASEIIHPRTRVVKLDTLKGER